MEDLQTAMRYVCQQYRDEDERNELVDLLIQEYQGLEPSKYSAVHKNVLGPGGYAFLYTDLFTLGNILDEVQDASNPSTDLALVARICCRLLAVWREHRALREPLSAEEFKVLRSIKKGCSTIEAVAAYTGLNDNVVGSVCESLLQRTYREEVPLLEVGPRGLCTRF